MMFLKELNLSHMTYGPYEGKIAGNVKFRNGEGEVTLFLKPHHCDAFLKICADAIIEQSAQVAESMIAPLIEAQKITKGESL